MSEKQIGLNTTGGQSIKFGDHVHITIPSDEDNSFFRSNAGKQAKKFGLKTFVFYIDKRPWYELLLSMFAFRDDLSFLTEYEFYSHGNDDYARGDKDDDKPYNYLNGGSEDTHFFRYILKSGKSVILDNDDKILKLLGKSKWTVYCSNCGGEFKNTEKTGFSHCEDHKEISQ